jgi:hypothetical protein
MQSLNNIHQNGRTEENTAGKNDSTREGQTKDIK